jgi:hypothetical protein
MTIIFINEGNPSEGVKKLVLKIALKNIASKLRHKRLSRSAGPFYIGQKWVIISFRGFFHTFSVSGGKVSGKHVTQGFSPDSSLRARGPHGPAAALKG